MCDLLFLVLAQPQPDRVLHQRLVALGIQPGRVDETSGLVLTLVIQPFDRSGVERPGIFEAPNPGGQDKDCPILRSVCLHPTHCKRFFPLRVLARLQPRAQKIGSCVNTRESAKPFFDVWLYGTGGTTRPKPSDKGEVILQRLRVSFYALE